MSSFDEVNIAREKLMEALGEKKNQYIHHMKLWFQMKSTKEDFDLEARKLLDSSQVQFHNQFLLQLFLKCSKQDSAAASPSTAHQRSKTKRRTRQNNGGFQPANIHDYTLPRVAPRPQEEPMRCPVQELFLPDCELIHMRLLLAAWELGLKGAEQSAAEILVVAVQHFLKNIMSAILSRKSGFQVRENRIQYAVGMPVPNPWLRNTAAILSNRKEGPLLEVVESGESVPGGRPSTTQVQQDIALAYAAGPDCSAQQSVTAADCFDALQVYRSTVPSTNVYAINMERISAQVHHISWDEMGE